MPLNMFGQGNGAGRPQNGPFAGMPTFNDFNRQTPNKPYNSLKNWTPPNTGSYGPMNVNNWDTVGNTNTDISAMPAMGGINSNYSSTPNPQVQTSWLDNVNSFLGPIGGLTGGLTGLLGAGTMLAGMLGHSKLDLGEQRHQLGKLSGQFQERGNDAWGMMNDLYSGKAEIYNKGRAELGRQGDAMVASMRNSMVGAPSAQAYRRNMTDIRRQMMEQMSSGMNQMYMSGMQQASQYGGLASDLWRNRIGAEQAIAQLLEAENKSANEPYGQLMNMGGGILGGLLGGILG